MESVTLPTIWAVIAWIAAAIVLLANAADKIAAVIKNAKAPNAQQNDRLDALEEAMKQVQQYLTNDKFPGRWEPDHPAGPAGPAVSRSGWKQH